MNAQPELELLDDVALQKRIVTLRVKKRSYWEGDPDYEKIKNLECQCHMEQLFRYYKRHGIAIPEPALPVTKPEPMKAKEKHRKTGSRKAQVHDVFLSRGRDAAIKLGKSLGLSDLTVATWIRVWKKGK